MRIIDKVRIIRAMSTFLDGIEKIDTKGFTMGNILRNWKTTLTGVIAILTAFIQTPLDIAHVGQLIPGILAGIGLILAKDGSVTGTTAQPR